MGVGRPVVGEGWWRIEMGDEGVPHGVLTLSVATFVKWGSCLMPVPPITAMRTGSDESWWS